MINEVLPAGVREEFWFIVKVFQQKLQQFWKLNSCQDVNVNILVCSYWQTEGKSVSISILNEDKRLKVRSFLVLET